MGSETEEENGEIAEGGRVILSKFAELALFRTWLFYGSYSDSEQVAVVPIQFCVGFDEATLHCQIAQNT